MIATVPQIPLVNLALAFLPVLVVLVILHRWSIGIGGTLYATGRMLVQLLLVGYVLAFIFKTDHPGIIIATLGVMLTAASWIALRPMSGKSWRLFQKSFVAIAVGAGLTLLVVTQGVLRVEPWFLPRRVIPFGGMCLAAAMNCISLAGERFQAERAKGAEYIEARRDGMRASLITITNSLLAVGLVSLPGMMTGMVLLKGVDPVVAARYQIVVMCMVFSSGGIAAALFLRQMKPKDSDIRSDTMQ